MNLLSEAKIAPWRNLVILGLFCILAAPASALDSLVPTPVPTELYTAAPLVAEGLVFIASAEAVGHGGHLRAFDPARPLQGALWDAAEHIPLPGIGAAPGNLPESDPPWEVSAANRYRTVFTNRRAVSGAQALVPLDGTTARALQQDLAVPTPEAALALVHALRGRSGCREDLPIGVTDSPQRLWGIRNSRPVLVKGAGVMAAAEADPPDVLYVGAEDGLLHAFQIAHDQITASVAGTELWAYLPGSLLPHLKEQAFGEPETPTVLHADGTLLSGEFFVDLDGDGSRRWRTLLVGTASVLSTTRSCLFVLDISDPLQPQLLWEQPLPGQAMGLTRGVTAGRTGVDAAGTATLFLSAADLTTGIHFCAVDLMTGQLRWQFRADYPAGASALTEAPAVPSLMDRDHDGRLDTLVCGDLAGRLWALDAVTGTALGGGPAYQLEAGEAEPIGAPVGVWDNLAVFGTGGAAHADDQRSYGIYAVAIGPAGGQLLWSYPLARGEKVWSRPVLDTYGHLLVGTANAYRPEEPTSDLTSGRLLILDDRGAEMVSEALPAAAVGQIAVAEGLAVGVTLTGDVRQSGSGQRRDLMDAGTRSRVRVRSWRLR